MRVENISPTEERILDRIPRGLALLIESMEDEEENSNFRDTLIPEQEGKFQILQRPERSCEEKKLYVPEDEGINKVEDVLEDEGDDDEGELPHYGWAAPAPVEPQLELPQDPQEQVLEAEVHEDMEDFNKYAFEADPESTCSQGQNESGPATEEWNSMNEEDENAGCNDPEQRQDQDNVIKKKKKNKKQKNKIILDYAKHVEKIKSRIAAIESMEIAGASVPCLDVSAVSASCQVPNVKVKLVNEDEQVLKVEDYYDNEDTFKCGSPDDFPFDTSEENVKVGEDGDLLIPDPVTEEEFTTKFLANASRPRPYIFANICGVKIERALIDSGAAVNTVDSETLNDIKAKLAEMDLTLPTLASEIAIRCFGGRIVENNEIVLLNIKICPTVIIQNLPVLVVSETGTSRGLLLGSPFLDLTSSKLEYKDDGTCVLHAGTGQPADMVQIRAQMVGNTHHVNACSTVELMPRIPTKVRIHFTMADGVATTLDKVPMILESKVLEDLLGVDQSQVVWPTKGKMEVCLTNATDQPITIFENGDVGQVTTAESVQSSIDLSIMRKYVHSVELSEKRLINCLCPESIGTAVGVIMALDKDDFSLFGTRNERVTSWDYQNRYNKKTERLTSRGNFMWIRTNHEQEPHKISQEDVNFIKKRFPLSMYTSLLFPYSFGRHISLPVMNSIQELRNIGYKVNIACFQPTHPLQEEEEGNASTCDVCISGTFSEIFNDREKYRFTDVKIVFPTRYGLLPPNFNTKIKGTKIGTFRLWEWHVTYFIHDINTVGVIVHMPQIYTLKPDQIQWHCAVLFKYLKVSFPKAKVTIETIVRENDQLHWIKPVEDALRSARLYRDYYDASLGKARKRRDKHEKETFDHKNDKCGCQFCRKTELFEKMKLLTVYSDFWGIDPEWELKIKQYQKELRKGKALADKADVTIIDLVDVADKSELDIFPDQLELITMAANECAMARREGESDLEDPEGSADLCEIHFHCHGEGDCGERKAVIDLKREPKLPDKIQRGFDPSDHFECKAPIHDVSEHVNLDHLTEAQKSFVLKLLEKHVDVLSISKDDRRYIRDHYLSFDVSDESPWYLPPYPMSNALQTEYMSHFENLVKKGFAIPDTNLRFDKCLFYSPSFLVWRNSEARLEQKREFRLVTDYSRVNTLIKDSFRGDSVVKVDKLLEAFSGTRFSSVVDATNFFPSFRVDRHCQKYMGMSSPGNNYELISIVASLGIACWPGLANISSRCMLRNALKPRVSQYVDDYSINSVGPLYPLRTADLEFVNTGEGLTQDFFEHLALLDHFFEDAHRFGILFSFSKIKLFATEFSYLGYNLKSGGRITIPENKIKSLLEFPVESDKLTPKDLQGILGMLNFLSQSICSYSAKTFLLHQKATEKIPGKQWKLDRIHKDLLHELIQDAAKAHTRYVYNSAMPLDIYVDSSMTSMAASFFNRDVVSGRLYLVRFASWRHTDHDIRCLPAILKEIAVTIKVCRSFPEYFQNTDPALQTSIITDQKTVRELLVNQQLNSPNPRIQRWLTTIANLPLNFNFKWSPGTAPPLAVADFGSRDPRLRAGPYISRFSNKLEGKEGEDIPQELRPKWNGVVTSEQIRKFIKQHELIKWPKSHKNRVLAQDMETDTWGEDDYEKLALSYFLPKLEWPGKHHPVPDTEHVTRPASIKSQTSKNSSYSDLSTTGTEIAKSVCTTDRRVSQNEHAEELGPLCSEVCVSSATLCNKKFAMKSLLIDVCPLIFNTPFMQEQFRHSVEELLDMPYSLHDLALEQNKDDKLRGIKDDLAKGAASKTTMSKFSLYDGCLLVKRGKDGVYRIPVSFQSLLILASWTHLWSHSGINSTQKCLSTYYTSPFMTQIVKAVCSTCMVCKFSKPALTKRDCQQGVSVKPQSIFSHLVMDHMTMSDDPKSKEKYKHVLVVMDAASRLIMPIPTVSTGQEETATALYHLLSHLPQVHSISSDNAPGLIKSVAVRKVLKKFGIKSIFRLPRLPTAGSLVERGVQSMRSLFRLIMRFRKTTSWLNAFPYVTRAINYCYRRYYIIQDNKIKSIWTNPLQLAYNIEARLRLKDLLGDREQPLSLTAQREWKKRLTEAMGAFEDNKQELQRQLDAKEDDVITTNSIVLIKHTRREKRRTATFYKNLYKVVSRKHRKVVVKPLFGDPKLRSTLYDVYVGHLVPFSQSELLRHLPPKYQVALGANVPLKPQFELPEQLWDFDDTERGKMDALIEKEMKKYAKKQARQGKASQTISTSSSESLDEESDDEDLVQIKKGKIHIKPPKPEFPESIVNESDNDPDKGEFDQHRTVDKDDSEIGLPSEDGTKKKRSKAKRFAKWAQKYWKPRKKKK